MAFNRVAILGGLVIIAGVVLTPWRGIVIRAQPGEASPYPTVHSIKVSLAPSAPDGDDCQIRLIPDAAGVYPADTIRINVENGCKENRDIIIRDFRVIEPDKGSVRLFGGETTPKMVPLRSGESRYLALQVDKDQPGLARPHVFEYTVEFRGPRPTGSVKGTVCFCRQPPCPPVRRRK